MGLTVAGRIVEKKHKRQRSSSGRVMPRSIKHRIFKGKSIGPINQSFKDTIVYWKKRAVKWEQATREKSMGKQRGSWGSGEKTQNNGGGSPQTQEFGLIYSSEQ